MALMWAITSLYQDFRFGDAEGYAEFILNGGWINKAITIPIAIGVLVYVGLSMLGARTMEKKIEEFERIANKDDQDGG
jgi:hypothetical protein